LISGGGIENKSEDLVPEGSRKKKGVSGNGFEIYFSLGDQPK